MAEMMGLMQLRRESATASDELTAKLLHAERALEIHWRGFMKTAADVLNEQQGDAATIAPAAAREDAAMTTEAAATPTNSAQLALGQVPQGSVDQPSHDATTSDGPGNMTAAADHDFWAGRSGPLTPTQAA